jgi:hypothetical protein
MYSISRNGVTAGEIVSRVRISDVWQALGGKAPKRGRAPAFWRQTKDLNVSLDDAKGAWFDFRDSTGGGVLDLVQHVRECSRQDALKWLADFAGVPLQDRPLTEGERREYARQRAVAEREAGALIAWRDRLARALEEARDGYLRAYHRAVRVILRHGLDAPEGQLAADVADCYEARYQELDRKLDVLRRASMTALLGFYRTRNLRSVAA